jgi:hypothetical protein
MLSGGCRVIRTQVQLTEQELNALRRLSAATGSSIAELIRNGIDQYLAGKRLPDPADRIERAIRVAGKFSSRPANVSEEHDRHLAEAFKA